MSETRPADALDVDGVGAPPRRNGELTFESPWESRAFGLVMALRERGCFEWEEFRRALIEEIAAWEQANPDRRGWSYYDRWLAALERVLVQKGLCAPGEIRERAEALARRPPGHDHGSEAFRRDS